MSVEAGAKSALVTGAARRIGRAISETLSQAGYRVVVHASRRSADEALALAAQITATGGCAVAVIADLDDIEQTQALLERAREAVGPLDLIVNNASIFEADEAITFDVAHFERMMRVNLRAPLQLAAAFAKSLGPDAEGCIVNILDQRVWRLNPKFFSYTLSKAALWTATQTMAQAFAPRIRVNAVGPGPTLANKIDGGGGFEREAAAVLLGRAVEPQEIAEAVLYLAQARGVTGQMIAVDGGQHLAWRTPDVV